jgi:hypothetical protein
MKVAAVEMNTGAARFDRIQQPILAWDVPDPGVLAASNEAGGAFNGENLLETQVARVNAPRPDKFVF